MKRRVFVSFRASDGIKVKEDLCKRFSSDENIIDCSEDKDRSRESEETIKKYLYGKLKNTSVTIVLLTPNAIEHERNWCGKPDDWIYDEIRYSLEDRENNKCNGLIAVYTEEAKKYLIEEKEDCISVKDVYNLFRKNMMNVYDTYKICKIEGRYDANYDSYCSLISYKDFISNPIKYIEIAEEKRDNKYKY